MTTPTLKTWNQRAEEAIQAGYEPGGPWEMMLKRHMMSCFPALVAELEATGSFVPYLQTMTASAKDLYATMLEQGTKPMAARELAMDRLLPKPPEEEEFQMDETEGGDGMMEELTQQYLDLTQQYLDRPQPE